MADRERQSISISLATKTSVGGYSDPIPELALTRNYRLSSEVASGDSVVRECPRMAREPNALTNRLEPEGSGDAAAYDPGVACEEVIIGRYTLHARIASGGMASVYLGSLAGAAEFSRLVAIKRMHPQFAADPEFSERFRDEARLTARLLHPNIVQSLDVVQLGGELLLIMEYVDGVTLNSVCQDACASTLPIPLKVVSGIIVPVLHGLHAAHVATDDEGGALGIVHRDFSPQNIIIGRDGHSKILDFGIAKARTHHHITVAGQFSGKFGYLSPEQVRGKDVDQRTDVFAAGVVLWELLAGRRLFREPGLSEGATVERVLNMEILRPSQFNSLVDSQLDDIVLRALQRDPSQRFPTALELAVELEAADPIASPSLISAYLMAVSAERLARLSRMLTTVRRRMGASSREALSLPVQAGHMGIGAFDVPRTVVSAMSNRDSMATELNVPQVRSSRRAALLAFSVLVMALGLLAFLRSFDTHSKPAQRSSETAASARSQEGKHAVASIVLPAVASVEAMTAHVEAIEHVPVSSTNADLPENSARPLVDSAKKLHQSASKTRRPPGIAKARPLNTSVAPITSASSCDPPTYVDAGGIRHFKAGCL